MRWTERTARLLVAWGALSTAYLLAGRVALLLAIPPAYASPHWPPAGFSLAAGLLGGPRMLPGVLLGAFLLELSIGRPGIAPATRAGVALVVALGAVLQVVCGLGLIRWASGRGNPLDRSCSILPVITLGGPVACTINATVATLALWASGTLGPEDLTYTWGAWWLGDSGGVVFFAPMLLAWYARPAAAWRRRRATVIVPLLVAFGLVMTLYVDTTRSEAARVQEAFDDRAEELAELVAHDLDVQIALLRSVEGLFAASTEVNPEEFAAFARITRSFAPGLRALQWAPVLVGNDGIRVPVTYVEPLAGNEADLAVDLASVPRRRAAVERARSTDAPAASAPLPLGSDGGVVVLIVSPVRDGRGVEGVVAAVLDVREFVERTLQHRRRPGIALSLVDGGTGDILYAEEAGPARWRWIGDIPCAGRTWLVELSSSNPGSHSWIAWMVLAGGLLLAGLLVTVIVEMVTRTVQIEAVVASRTADLERANAALLQSNTDLQRFAYVASHDMREPLRVVTSYAELLAEEVGPQLAEEPRRRLSRVVENARRMQSLVKSLLEHARAGGRAEPFRPADLGSLARGALDELGVSVQESGAVVTLKPLPTVSCDAVEMLSVFQNLLGNALKFRRQGVPPEVTVGSRRVAGAWEISVRDNGVGVPAEHRERIFEMFQRLHPRDRYPGTGMGLAVCRRVIERHGGKIWIEPVEGPGTLVRFTLPDRS